MKHPGIQEARSARRGSLDVLETFFGSEIGRDVTAETILQLPLEQFRVLREQLHEASWDDLNDLQRAAAWKQAAKPPRTARVPTSEALEREESAIPLIPYADHVVCEDPMLLVNTRDGCARCLESLVQLRPLVDAGYLSFFPRKLGWQLFNPIQKPPLPGRELEMALQMKRCLPWTSDEEMEMDVIKDLAAAMWLDLDPVAVASRPGLLNPFIKGLGTSIVRQNQLGPTLLPSFSHLGIKALVKLRRDSGGLAAVRNALDRLADELPADERATPSVVESAVLDILHPAAQELRREIRRFPTLESCVGFGLAVSAAVASLTTGTVAPAGIVTAAGSPLPLVTSWIKGRFDGRAAARASRVLVELAATEFPYSHMSEDRRPRELREQAERASWPPSPLR